MFVFKFDINFYMTARYSKIMKIVIFAISCGLCFCKPPPKTWQENWFEHDQLLTLHYHDPEVAIYFDKDVDRSTTWVNQYLHDVWVYTKKIYGQFGPDPHLYAIFHTGKYNGGHPATYFDSQKSYRNVIDVGMISGSAWKDGRDSDFDFVTGVVGFIVQFANNGVHNSPAYPIWINHFNDIYVYDVYMGLGRQSEAKRWYKSKITDNWFINWFFPIYEKYGESLVLNRFFQLLNQYFPKTVDGKSYSRNLNFGEFIHFWSGASKKNLKDLAKKAFGWNNTNQEEFDEARTNFPGVTTIYDPPKTWRENWTNHNQLLTRTYHDDDIAVYFDPDVDKSISWMNGFLSKAWKYTKETYGTFFGDDPHLYAIFHTGKYPISTPAVYFDSFKSYRNVIDCGKLEKDAWKSGTGNNLDVPIHEISHIVEGASHGIHESPAFTIWGDSKWAEIFIYDVYLALDLGTEAERWRQMQLLNHDNFPKNNTYWFRDWFLPIYEQHGGAQVLDRFFDLLAKFFSKTNNATYGRPEYSRRMTHGEFFHFWSGAAGVDLKNLATKAFGWSDQYEKEFEDAKRKFPGLVY